MNGPCKEYQDLIADRVLGLLDPTDHEALFEHINTCTACKAFLQAQQNNHNLLLRFGADLETAWSARIERCIVKVNRIDAEAEERVLPLGRRIKMTTLIKFAAAAVIVVGVFLVSLLPPGPGNISPLTLLSAIHAAENALLQGEQALYIRNDITVYPSATFNEIGGGFLPTCSLKADGQFRFDQLKLTAEDNVYTVIDQAWYDPPTGRFVRLLEVDDQIIFGNAYDGTHMYNAEWDASKTLQVRQQSLDSRFTAPESPAGFFGLAAGLPSGLSEDTQNLVSVETDTLADGSPVHVFKVAAPGPQDPNQTYWLFKVRDDNQTIAEKEFVVNNETYLLIRRVLSEPTDATGIHWDMQELQGQRSSTEQTPKAAVNANMIQIDVSVQHIVEAAAFETYMFKQLPVGIQKWQTMDINVAGPEERMFLIAGRAEDKRHVLLMQSLGLSQRIGQGDKEGVTLVHTTPNGIMVWAGSPPGVAKMLLQSAVGIIKDKPADDCVLYGLEFPEGFFAPLVINGTVTEQELEELTNNLIPSREYLRVSK